MNAARAVCAAMLACAALGCAPKRPIEAADFYASPIAEGGGAMAPDPEMSFASPAPVLEVPAPSGDTPEEGGCQNCCSPPLPPPPRAPFDPSCVSPVTHEDQIACALKRLSENEPEPEWLWSLLGGFLAALVGGGFALLGVWLQARIQDARDRKDRNVRLERVANMANALREKCRDQKLMLFASPPATDSAWAGHVRAVRVYIEAMAFFMDKLETQGISSADFFNAMALARMNCDTAVTAMKVYENPGAPQSVAMTPNYKVQCKQMMDQNLDMVMAAMEQVAKQANALRD